MAGVRPMQAAATSAKTTAKKNTSVPAGTRGPKRRVIRSQAKPAITIPGGTTRTMRASAGSTCSRMGASHNPARNPRTTLGSDAMISTTGLTTPFSEG